MFQKYFFLIHYSVSVWNISVTFGTISNRVTVRKVSATYHRQVGTSMCQQCLSKSVSQECHFSKMVLYIGSLVIGWVFKNWCQRERESMCACVCECFCAHMGVFLEIKTAPKNPTSTCRAQHVTYVACALCQLTGDFPQSSYPYGSCICYDDARFIAKSNTCGVSVYQIQFSLLISIVEYGNQIYHWWLKIEQPSACLW